MTAGGGLERARHGGIEQIIESDQELIEGAWWIAGPKFTEDPMLIDGDERPSGRCAEGPSESRLDRARGVGRRNLATAATLTGALGHPSLLYGVEARGAGADRRLRPLYNGPAKVIGGQ
jgi:hypothetical protein